MGRLFGRGFLFGMEGLDMDDDFVGDDRQNELDGGAPGDVAEEMGGGQDAGEGHEQHQGAATEE